MSRDQTRKDGQSPQDQEIRDYIESCKILNRELTQAIDILEFKKKGGTIRYAIDFSEIRAYILPAEATEESFKEFFLPAEEEFVEKAAQSARLIQLRALEILFGQSGKLILLAPYAIELKRFLKSFSNDHLHSGHEKVASQLPTNIDREIKELSEKEGFQRFQELVKKFQKSNEALSPEEETQIIDFLEKNTPGIVAILERQNYKPLGRLNYLFANERFENLEALGLEDEISSLDRGLELYRKHRENREQVIEKSLVEARSYKASPSSSALDAMAIATVEEANQKLQQQNRNTKLLLVTRSKWMHEILKQHSDGESSDFIPILCHPRIFLIILYGNVYDDKALQHLKDLRTHVQRFLESVSDSSLEEFQKRQENQEYQAKLLKRVKRKWRAMVSLATPLTSNSGLDGRTLSPASERQSNLQSFRQILLQLLQDSRKLRELLSRRLDQLTDEWVRDKDILGLWLEKLDPRDRGFVDTPLQPRPYSLNFNSDRARDLLNSWKRLEDVLKSLESVTASDAPYEILLAFAYAFGNLDRWALAEIYCKEAIAKAEKDSDETCEGYFFLAVSMRKLALELPNKDQGYECLREALTFLEKAIKARQLDPRYLTEKGTQTLILNTYFEEEKYKKRPVAEGLELFNQAEKQIQDDLLLKIQICNNRLFYYINDYVKLQEKLQPHLRKPKALQRKYDPDQEKSLNLRDKLSKYSRELEDLQSEYERDPTKWLPSVLDTLAKVRWCLKGAETDEEKRKILKLWELALNSDKPPSPSERKIIEQHQKEFKKASKHKL